MLFVFLAILGANSTAQTITISEDIVVSDIMSSYESSNRNSDYIKNGGFRIQIATSRDRMNMDGQKQKFLNSFPGYRVKRVYKAPNYKLMVGAYLTKLEATQTLNTIRGRFSSARIVPDKEVKYQEIF